MRILVIVVTYNGEKWISRCLESVWGSSVQADAVVIDNASSDGTLQLVREHFPWVRLVAGKENLGFGAANNIGLRMALEEGYDYAYLLNQDAWIFPDTLGKLVGAAEKEPSYAILSPVQMEADLLHEDVLFSRIPRADRGDGTVMEVRRVMAAHWLVRLKALREVGLFAPIFHHYGEDDNLCCRLRHRGWKIGIVPSAKAVHDRAGRDLSSPAARQRTWRITSLVILCDPSLPLWVQWLHVLAFTLVKTVKNRSLSPLKELPSLFSMRDEIIRTRKP